MKKALFILGLLFITTIIFAQTTVKGIVTDQSSKEGLIGVNIELDNGSGTTSDIDGSYELVLENGSYNITFSYLGYKNIEQNVEIAGEEVIILDIAMNEASEMLVITTVTSSKYEKNIT